MTFKQDCEDTITACPISKYCLFCGLNKLILKMLK